MLKRTLFLFGLLYCTAGLSQTVDVSVLIENQPTLGCDVLPTGGLPAIPGIDARLTAQVDTTTFQVTDLFLSRCSGGSFGPSSRVGGGYPVGLDLGTAGGDVIESSLDARTLVGSGGTLQFTYLAESAAGGDVTGVSGPLTLAFGIPTLGLVGGFLMVLVLGAIGMKALRRNRRLTALFLVGITFSAWAMNFMLDGQVGDWAGIAPAVTDPAADPTTGEASIDILAGFAAIENQILYFRVDVTDVENTPPVAQDDSFATDEDNPVAGDVLADNGNGVDSDPDGDPITVTELDGAAAAIGVATALGSGALVTLNASGAVTYDPAGAFESLAQGATTQDNFQYTLADNNGGVDTATVTIDLTGVNDPPTVMGVAAAATEDGAPVLGNFAGDDVDSDDNQASLTYTLQGVAAEGTLTNNNDGTFTFDPGADFQDLDTGETRDVMVDYDATDSNAATSGTATITVTVTGVNDPPVITTPASVSAPENQTAVIDVDSTDAEGDVEGAGLSYGLTGGADQALFAIDGNTGVLTFLAAPDFEAPADANADNDYLVQVTVTDSGALTDVQDLTVTVTDVNDPPVITSPAAVTAAENQTAVVDVQSTDPEGDTEGAGLSYSLTGGADQGLFGIDVNSGVLTFLVAPDFEVPADANTDNDYLVQVTVTDSGGMTGVQDLVVTVTNVPEPPIITSPAMASVPENQTAAIDVMSTDPEGDVEGAGLTYAISGGADQALFGVNTNSGVLSFNAAPDFESPADAGFNNVYDVQVTVTDSSAMTDVQDLMITVTNVNEQPMIVSGATVNVDEGTTAVIDVMSTDPDGETEGAGLSYTLTGGADQALFGIVAGTGVLSFNAAPDFEAPADAGADNVYDVQVTVTDGGGLTNVQNLMVTVLNVNEPPALMAVGPLAVTPNIRIDVPDGVSDLLFLASDPDGDAVTIDDADGIIMTAMGGTITANTSTGVFTYDPPAGVVATDSFMYQVCDPGMLCSGNVTVMLNITGNVVWFVQQGAAGSNSGTLTDPYQSLQDFNTANGNAGGPQAGHRVFLFSGSFTTGTTLLNNQLLFGQGMSGTFDTDVLGGMAAANSIARPAVGGAAPTVTGNGIGLGSGNTVRGLDIANTGGSGISGTNFGTLTVSEVDVSGTAQVLSLNTGTVNAGFGTLATTTVTGVGIDLQSVTSTSFTAISTTVTMATSDGIALQNNTGTFSFGTLGNLTSSAGRGLFANNSGTVQISGNADVAATGNPVIDVSGTALNVTFGNLTSTNSSTRGIRLDTTSGSLVVNTRTNISGSAGTGVDITGSTGTFTFGDLDIDTSANNQVGLFANGGTVNAGSGTINAGNNRGVDINNTTLGLTLTSVSSSGGTAPGIDLDTTTGGLTVAGTGAAASGGTIANKTGANGSNDGIGIRLNAANNVTINDMQLNDFQNFAIRGTSVVGFTLSDTTISGINGTSAAFAEGSVSFDGLTGTALVEGSDIAGGLEDNIRIVNTAGILTMNVQDSPGRNMIIGLNSVAQGNDGILVETRMNAMATVVIDGVDFLGARGDLFQANAIDNSILNPTLQNSVLNNAHPNIVPAGGGITISGGGAAANFTMNYAVTGNSFSGADGNAITANFVSGMGLVNGTIANNTVGIAGMGGSGSLNGNGISVGASQNVDHGVSITNNQIFGVDGFGGIDVVANMDVGFSATITGNSISQLGGFTLAALTTLVGGAGTETGTACLDISGNTFNALAAPFAGNAIYMDQISAMANYNLPGYMGSANGEFAVPAGTASADLDTFLSAQPNTLTNGPFPGFPGGVDAGVVQGVTGVGAICP